MFPPWTEAKNAVVSNGVDSVQTALPEPRRPCLVCQMRFAAANRLPQPTRCLLCKAAVAQSEMIDHIKEMHIRLHRCNHCDRAFGSPDQLDQHVQESHTAPPLQTLVPPRPPASRPRPTETAATSRASWTCEYCRKVFTYEAVWRLHLGIHSGPQPYFCVKCKRRMATQGELDSHIQLRECGGRKRPPSWGLTDLMSVMRRDVGGEGDAGTRRRRRGRSWVDQAPPSELVMSLPGSGAAFTMVGARKARATARTRKVKAEAANGGGACEDAGDMQGVASKDKDGVPQGGEDRDGNAAAKDSTPTKAVFACPLCSKRYKKKKYFTNHIAAHTAGKKYCCERCGRSYLFKGFMLKHMLSVHNMAPKATCCDQRACPDP